MTLSRVVYFGQSLNILDFLLLRTDIEVVAVFVPHLDQDVHKEFVRRMLLAQVEQFFIGLKPQKILQVLPSHLDVGICAHFEVIPQSVLQAFRLGIINIHPAPLPKYPGRYPLIDICLAGEMESGVSIHWMSSRVDQGDLIAEAKFKRHPVEGPIELEKRAEQYACHLLTELWPAIIEGYAPRQAQVKRMPKRADRHLPCPCSFDRLLDLLRASQAYGPYGGLALYESKLALVLRIKDLKLLSLTSLKGLEVDQNPIHQRGFYIHSVKSLTEPNLGSTPLLSVTSNWSLSSNSKINQQSIGDHNIQFEASFELFNEDLRPLSQEELTKAYLDLTNLSQKLFLSSLPKTIRLELP